jgi:hypothetical protein
MSTSHNAFLPPDLRELIDADRNAADPSETVRQDVARRVDRALGLGGAMLIPLPASLAPLKTVAPKAASVALPAAAGVAAWKIAVGVAVIALAGGGGFTLASRRAPAVSIQEPPTMAVGVAPVAQPTPAVQQPMLAAQPTSVPVAGSTASLPSVSLDLDAPVVAVAPSSKARSPERAHPARVADRLADERVLLDRARSALVRRDAADALAAIRAHEKSFARGQLVEEREGMRVQALVVARDFGSARAAGERFHKVYPRSVFLPVVDRALEIAR